MRAEGFGDELLGITCGYLAKKSRNCHGAAFVARSDVDDIFLSFELPVTWMIDAVEAGRAPVGDSFRLACGSQCGNSHREDSGQGLKHHGIVPAILFETASSLWQDIHEANGVKRHDAARRFCRAESSCRSQCATHSVRASPCVTLTAACLRSSSMYITRIRPANHVLYPEM